MTLVALLAVTTGAWAEETPIATILASENSTFVSGSKTFADKVKITFSGAVDWLNNRWQVVYNSTNGNEGTVTVEGVNGTNISKVVFYDNYGSHVMTTSPYTLYFYQAPGSSSFKVCTGANGEGKTDISMITKIEVFGAATPSGPEVAWNKTSKTGTFTMPGGNVTLEPEYYPQAALTAAPTAINDVPATTDGAIVSAGTVANIGETTTAQGTVMYYVSPSALDDAALLALAADQWTADVPTAADLAQGPAYVYYYVRGNDSDTDEENFSDGDIKADYVVSVTLAAEPTYAVTFADGVNPEPPAEPEWTASPAADVKKGETVTVTYTGTKKVIGVKAEKKAATPASTPLDNTTTAWTAGTYAVPAGGLTYSDAITVSGDVTLTLTDGETLTLNKGISLASGATLTIQGNGTMNVNGTNNSTASTVAGSTGTLILTSGTLNAKGGNGQDMTDGFKTGASGGAAINGSVTVNGGSLTANGGNGGNCIGATIGPETNGGAGGAAISGDVTITDGAVAATGGNGGSIGASNYGEEVHGGAGGAAIGGNATLTGGTLTATQGANGTGSLEDSSVGAGGKAVAGTVTNNGGTVN